MDFVILVLLIIGCILICDVLSVYLKSMCESLARIEDLLTRQMISESKKLESSLEESEEEND